MRAFVTNRFAGRLLVAFLLSVLACSGFARAASPITVNKQFGSNTINLGQTTTVTVTLENSSTTAPANISAFTDDLATMGGVATFAATPNLATTCAGGTPTISGSAVVMNNGQIPQATDPSTPATCTITFNVVGAQVGSGGNQILGTNVVTDLGDPSTITQTLVVNPVSLTTTGSGTQTIQAGTNGTVTFTITNPAGVAITNTSVPLVATGNGTLNFSVTGGTTTCAGGTVALPPTGTSGTATMTGGTIPANGSCTITLTITTPSVLTVNVNLAAGSITDSQNSSNSGAGGASTSIDKFVLGQPNISKSFNPTTVVPGTTTTLKINIQNVLSSQALTTAGISDTLPASLTLVSSSTNAACGAGTVGGTGTGTITLSGATITANSTCTITAVVQIPAGQAAGGLTNTIPAASFTSDQVNGAAAAATANLTVTASGGGYTQAKSFNPTSVAPGTPSQVTLTFTSVGKAYTGETGTFTDPLPATPVNVSQMTYYTDATHVPGFSAGCGPTPSVTATPDLQTVNGADLDIPLNGTCVVTFWVEYTTPIPVSRTATNTITAANVTFGGTDHPTGNVSANLTELPALTLTNYAASQSGLINQPLTVTASINDPTGVTDGNLKATFPLNTGALTNVVLAPTPNFQFSAGCPTGIATYLTGAAGATSWSLGLGGAGAVPTLNATCTITYNVVDNGGVTGSFGPGTPVLNSNLTGGTNVNQSATNQVTFATTHLLVNKKFTPNQIQAGAVSQADITLTVAPISGFATTQANGVAFSDPLPSGMTFAPTPGVAFSAGCQQTGQPAPQFVITGSTIALSAISLLANGTVPVNCDVTFNVTASTVGAPLNSIAANSVTAGPSGITNPAGTNASLTVQAGVAIQKTFVNASFPIGGTDYVRLLLTNSASTSTLTGGSVTDPLPAQLALASTTPGPLQGSDPPSCGATITGTIGASSFTLTNITIGPVVGTTPGTCVEYVLIKAATGATAGPYTNTIPIGGLTIGGYTSKQPTSAPVTLTTPPNISLAKAFAPTTIAPTQTSVLTITVSNTAAGSVPLTGMAFTDTLPANITIAPTPGGATTCGAGTVTATAGGATVALAGGTIAASSTCTVTVNVTGTVVGGPYVNTIPTGGLTTNEGAKNPAPATAPITIANAPSVTLSKAFAPVSIPPGGTSVLTITVANTASGAVALSGMNLTDTLPANITIASTPNASTTCGAGTVTATAGASSVALAGGSVAAAATCTIVVSVTGTIVGNYTNTIPANGLTTTQGASNPGPVTAPIAITNAPSVTIAKAFNPVSILPGGTSVLTITVSNTAAGSVALSGVKLTDTLPTNITVAATPNASTTCGAGTVAATAGASSVTLTAGSIGANASCTIVVSVTGTVVGTYTNTIPSGGLTSTQGATNPGPATAPITIANAPSVTVTKVFVPDSIQPGATSVLTISVANTASGSIALTGLSLTDTLPANITIAATPAASTTCTGGTVAATAGGSSVALSGGALAAGATCTIAVSVTGTITGDYTNTIPAGGVHSTQGGTNPGPAQAPITISSAPGVVLSKAFSPNQIAPGGISKLTITIANTHARAQNLTALSLIDTLPNSINIASPASASTTCANGSVGAVPGNGRVVLTGASLKAGATCTVTVNVTGTIPGDYVNTIPKGAVHTHQGASNPGPVTAPISIRAPKLSVKKSSDPENGTVQAGDVIAYTIVVTNSGNGPETNATIADTLTNATLVPGSVRVNGNPAPDAVVTNAKPFGTIAAGATVKITYSAKVNENVQQGATVANSVRVGGDQGCTGPDCVAVSPPNRIGPPKIQVIKRIDGKLNQLVVAGQVVVYSMTVTNTGGSDADNGVLKDEVPQGLIPIAGSVTVGGVPAPKATVVGQLVTVPLGTLLAGKSIDVAFKATVQPDESGPAVNVVTVDANGIKTIVSNPVTVLRVGTTIGVTKIPSATAATVGDRIDYLITVVPPPGVPPLDQVMVVDTLPAFEFYAPGTARLDGKTFNPTVSGQVLTWTIPKLSATATIFYSTVVGAGVPANSTLTNVVNVVGHGPPGSKPVTGTANATVQVLGTSIGSCYPITGRVYLDVKGSGRFEEGDIGIPAAYVYLDDGEYVVTDGYGRYNFPCVRPGMHALRLDESTLPPGVTIYDDRNIDSERSTRRLVHRVYDQTIIEDINFAVTGKPATPIVSPETKPSGTPAPPGFPPPK